MKLNKEGGEESRGGEGEMEHKGEVNSQERRKNLKRAQR